MDSPSSRSCSIASPFFVAQSPHISKSGEGGKQDQGGRAFRRRRHCGYELEWLMKLFDGFLSSRSSTSGTTQRSSPVLGKRVESCGIIHCSGHGEEQAPMRNVSGGRTRSRSETAVEGGERRFALPLAASSRYRFLERSVAKSRWTKERHRYYRIKEETGRGMYQLLQPSTCSTIDPHVHRENMVLPTFILIPIQILKREGGERVGVRYVGCKRRWVALEADFEWRSRKKGRHDQHTRRPESP